MTESVTLVYLAGLVDGEGSILLGQVRPSGQLRLRLQVAGTEQLLMDWLIVHFGGAVTRNLRKNPKHKLGLTWYVGGNRACELIKLIGPFLVVKRAQAELGIYAWEHREPVAREERLAGVPAEILERREQFVTDMHGLNKKGL